MLALMFQVGADRVAVEVRYVREVVPRVRLIPATGSPSWVAGLLVYRGRVVPLIDLHRLTNVGDCPPHLSSRIILVSQPDRPNDLVGLLATEVADIRDLSNIAPHSEPADTHTLGPAVADGSGILRLFNPDRFLSTLAPLLTGARS